MIQSMTGFASTTLNFSSSQDYQIYTIINLKTLNSRYFEITCKLPQALSHLETNFIKMLKERLQRGNIFLTITMSNQNTFQTNVEPSLQLAKNYVEAIRKVQKECSLPGQITIGDMLRLANNIFVVEQPQECEKSLETALLAAVDTLITTLIATRVQEGKALQKDIQERHDLIKQDMHKITTAAHNFLEHKKKEVAQKIAALEGESSELIQARKAVLHNELDKIDIHEEIVRFNDHLKNLDSLLDSDEQEKGRRINFILQELGREINTLSAKCSDVYIGSLAINIKVELEKIREQAQNII